MTFSVLFAVQHADVYHVIHIDLTLKMATVAVTCLTLACTCLFAGFGSGAQEYKVIRGGAATPGLPETLTIIDNGVIKVGIDSARGGSISYLAQSGTDYNVINYHDMGREVQLSFYSGPQRYEPTPGSDACNTTWRQGEWPWNPIGAGDIMGHAGQVERLDIDNSSGPVYVKSRPLQWACNNVPCNCTFEKWISFGADRTSVVVDVRLTNFRSDKTLFTAYGQELPAIYTLGDLYQVVAYNGTKPFTNDPNLVRPPVTTPLPLAATEHWAALVNKEGWGLGVFHPGTINIRGGYFGDYPGDHYKPTDFETGYLSPYHMEILDWNIQYNYTYHLVLGNIDTIRAHAYQHQKFIENCYANDFVHNRQHFYLVNANDTGVPNGYWEIDLSANDPQIIGPPCLWNAAEHKKVMLNVSYSTKQSSTDAQVFWNYQGIEPTFDGIHTVHFKIVADDQFHVYDVDLSQNAKYAGPVYGIRFDPVQDGLPGATVKVASITVM